MDLSNQKIVLIAPKYFDYELEIKSKLEEWGASVHLIYENMDKVSIYYKMLYSKFPDCMLKAMDKYFKKKLAVDSPDVSYVLVIRGQFLSKSVIAHMKLRFDKKCQYIFYQWDSVRNNENAKLIASEFDRVYTFDPEDAKLYKWIYRPLFYISTKINHVERKVNDLLYICSLHSDRARILMEIKRFCTKSGLSYRAILFEKQYIFLKRKYIDQRPEYISVSNNDMTFKPVTLPQAYELYGCSKAVIDYTHPGQKGYTMRTIECLGNRCKLITNNVRIREADFYDERNVYVYDNNKFKIPEEFIRSEYCDIDLEVYKYYSLDCWIETLLKIN